MLPIRNEYIKFYPESWEFLSDALKENESFRLEFGVEAFFTPERRKGMPEIQ